MQVILCELHCAVLSYLSVHVQLYLHGTALYICRMTVLKLVLRVGASSLKPDLQTVSWTKVALCSSCGDRWLGRAAVDIGHCHWMRLAVWKRGYVWEGSLCLSCSSRTSSSHPSAGPTAHGLPGPQQYKKSDT